MSSTSDPIRSWRLRIRTTWLVASPVIALASVWAFVVPGADPVGMPILESTPSIGSEVSPAELDLAVFDAALWVEPPAQEVAAAPVRPPPPPPPIKLQLLAVVRVSENDAGTHVLQAAIYDPDFDRLHFVRDGERVGRFTVVTVGPTQAVVRDGEQEVTLGLDVWEAGS